MNKVIINGVEDSRIDVLDRGFQYGDGLFETIAYKNNKLQLWDEHMQRLRDSCERLSLSVVDESLWLGDIKQCQLSTDAVIKLSLSRGVSGRGYAYGDNDSVTRVTASFKLPDYPQTNQTGISAVLCKTPVSVNPMLAGMKHLNRLDNVLARNEWHDSAIAEGFMFDSSGHIIQGTMSNVFCVLGDELYTPLLEQCGVAGIMREQVIALASELNIPLSIVDISKPNFLQMDGVFVTNSLIGIWPVTELGEIKFEQNRLIKRLQDELAKKQSG
jgi:4-amino-4-deoxychorismate lyase